MPTIASLLGAVRESCSQRKLSGQIASIPKPKVAMIARFKAFPFARGDDDEIVRNLEHSLGMSFAAGH